MRSHGLHDGARCRRALPAGVLAWVFAIESTRLVAGMERALASDPDWQRLLAASACSHWDLHVYATSITAESSQELHGGSRQGAWLHFDVQDGLPSVLVSHISNDPQGRLLLCTYEGMCHFDGARTQLTRLPEGTGRVAPDVDDGTGLWLTTLGGRLLCCRDDTAELFTAADGLPDDSVIDVCRANGRLWVASKNQLCYRDHGGVFHADTMLPPEAEVRCLFRTHADELVVGTSVGLFACLGEQTTRLGLPGQDILALCEDRHGRLVVATSQGLYRHSDQGMTTTALPEQIDDVTAICCDRRDVIWLATLGQGLLEWDGMTLTRHSTRPGMTSNQVRTIHEDAQGCLWVGTWGGGLARLDRSWLQSVTVDDGLGATRVESLCEMPDGAIVLGTWGAGAVCLRAGDLQPIPDLSGEGWRIWSSLVDRDGNLWLGTLDRGAVCWNGTTARFFGREQGLGRDSVFDLHQDRQGRIWCATQGGGLTCIDGDDCRTYTTRDGLPDDVIWTVTEDQQGHIWCSTHEAGVCRLDGERFTNYTTDDGLAHNQVWCALCDRQGNMWFGTWGGGVSRYDGDTFTTFTTHDGLAHNSVRHICQDRDGGLWFGTFGGGVSRFDGCTFQTLSRRDGLVHDAVQHVLQARDGSMWIATEEGVTHYQPPKTPPVVAVTGVVADRRYDRSEVVRLALTQRLVTVEFEGASFATPLERMAYIYRVPGVLDDWQVTRQRRVELRDLPLGEHAFEVRAVDRDLNYSEPHRQQISIEPDTGQDRLEALRAELAGHDGAEQFIGQSPSLRRVLDEIDIIAATGMTVLIEGETGTGKGLAARAIHALSQRHNGPFIQVNCGAIPAGLVESELFGHEKGAFTGATSRRIGRFELAEGGTLFLDEIGDLPEESQRALLNVLQEGVFQRVGSGESMQARARVITATNRDLRQATRQGAFREDLYFRLSPYVLQLPPLRKRLEDVPLLLEHFVEQFSRHLNRDVPTIEPEAMALLRSYEWPGNVRELEHLSQRATLVCSDGTIRTIDLPVLDGQQDTQVSLPDADSGASLMAFETAAAERERSFLLQALEATNWVIYGERGAARRLGVHPEKLRRRLRSLGLRRPA